MSKYGQCEWCGKPNAVLVACLVADPDQRVCKDCHAAPRVPTTQDGMYNVGDVYVTDASCTNPYRYKGEWYSGEPRRLALDIFRMGGDTTGMQLWFAPAEGGAQRITANQVRWS